MLLRCISLYNYLGHVNFVQVLDFQHEYARVRFMKKYFISTLLIFAILGCLHIFTAKKPKSEATELFVQNPATSTNSVSLPVDSTLIELDLSNITSQFVDDEELDYVPLSPELRKVKEFAANKLGEDVSNIVLRAVTPNAILISVLHESGGANILLDLNTQKSAIAGYFSIKTNDAFIYIDAKEISYYKLGQSSFIVLPGSELTSPETYMSTLGNMVDFPNETHTNKTITVSVYDSTKMETNPATQEYVGQKKIREVMYKLP